MNYTIILLAVVVVILIYILRSKVFKSSNSLADKVTLKTAQSIALQSSDVPTSLRYAYGVWIYMNAWNTAELNNSGTLYPQNNNIFKRDSDVQLYLDQNTPTLKFYVKENSAATPIVPITVTENFPIQKWVYFVANVDGTYIDLYLNGKLVKSVKLASVPAAPSGSAAITTGGGLDGFIAKFKRWSHPLTPKDVWSNYMNGNGGNSFSKMFTSYGVDVALVKNDIQQKSIRLF